MTSINIILFSGPPTE